MKIIIRYIDKTETVIPILGSIFLLDSIIIANDNNPYEQAIEFKITDEDRKSPVAL